jgi:RNA polymerase sigma-70 factor (ECF subfamily)
MMFFAPFRPQGAAPADAAAWHARVCARDRAALDHLYRLEAGPVYRYAVALTGNPAWAADAVQDAFLAYWTRPQGFEPARGSLGAYLAGAARHALLARWREAPVAEPAEGDADEPGVESPESVLLREQDTEALWRAIRGLPWPFREALVLVDLQGRAYAEAAAIAGVELNTVRTRVFRARRRLALALGAETGDHP